MKIRSIAAMTEHENIIGINGKIPFRIKTDVEYFVRETMGKDNEGSTCVYGRLTDESIPKKFRPFIGRNNIIITSNPNYELPVVPEGDTRTKVARAAIPEEAILIAQQDSYFFDKNLWLCGGGQIYQWGMDIVEELYITKVKISLQPQPGDLVARFPEIDPTIWSERIMGYGQENGCGFEFLRYTRI